MKPHHEQSDCSVKKIQALFKINITYQSLIESTDNFICAVTTVKLFRIYLLVIHHSKNLHKPNVVNKLFYVCINCKYIY